MQNGASQFHSRLVTLALGAMAAFLVIMIILFPDSAFKSSLEGLTLWWKLIFPSMLPYLILTELLIGFGALQAIGVLFYPLTRLLFRLPGVGGWALASAFIVGFPTGAKITASLRENKLLTRREAERLVALTHLCSPLFLITIVGVGFLQNAQLGLLLAIVHYLSAVVVGILISRSKMGRAEKADALVDNDLSAKSSLKSSLWRKSLDTMRVAYLHDGRAFGKLLGDAVTGSVQTLMLIGGYIMIFSVMLNVLTVSRISGAFQLLTSGISEIHLGAYALVQTQDIPLLLQMALLSAILAWGGLAVHAQVGGMIYQTDIRYMPFFLARILHAITAFLLTFLLWKPLQHLINSAAPSLAQFGTSTAQHTASNSLGLQINLWSYWPLMFLGWCLLLGTMIALALLLKQFHKQA
ncbi:nucleoside recognition domain-containing protein [Paenibacillus eucommiae]|uniref:Sporulation integral membrane protein YlbJ n=1 Tax=Paenibacillus eucommiae TaxID=1355755 RepID=A0ABS4IUY1_9BACL|nr:nucleoside recognition domain-containing protein [Paenibacillus eucommiae]MBP1991384.1 sporulation integral membrane protein YlbJ [Paenibacillus eucommiae]